MLPEPELRRALADIPAIPLHGPFSRFVSLEAMQLRGRNMPVPRPLWGIGSIKNGGRYNKPESFEVIYLAEDPVTALAEVNLIFRTDPALSQVKGPPMVHIAVEGILEKVLDVTLQNVQSVLATSHQELTGAWLLEQVQRGEAPTQRLGRVCFRKRAIARAALSIF
jgi:RES domain-containing protein